MHAGSCTRQYLESSLPFINDDLPLISIQSSKLRRKTKLISPQHQVGLLITIYISNANGIQTGELYLHRQYFDAELPVAFVLGNDGREVIERQLLCRF